MAGIDDDGATMTLDDIPDYGETYTTPALVTRPPFIRPSEPLEDVFRMFTGHPGSVIGHR